MGNYLKILFIFFLICFAVFPSFAQEPVTAPMIDPNGAIDIDALKDARDTAWEEWYTSMTPIFEETIIEGEEFNVIQYGNVQMRFTVEIFGERPEEGYPMYIAMHGGGSDDTPDFNDSQWEAMQNYYTDHLECGVYIAVRGIRDTWDTHFNPESYPIYDRLIEYMIMTNLVDPNRVYLEGFSAGGDGVYAIGARMADRFAAANMSSGHPNDISMYNFCNLPIQLQAGEYDTDFDRNTVTAAYGLLLDQLETENPDGFVHRTLIHADRGHNYEDYNREPVEVMADVRSWLEDGNRETILVDSYPHDWMDQFVRNPIPDTLYWDLETRAELRDTDSFYYLSADRDASGKLFISRMENEIMIVKEDFEGDFTICFNEDMIDFTEPVHFMIEDLGEIDVLLIPEEAWLSVTTEDRGDPNFQFEAAVTYSWLEEQIRNNN